MPTTHYLASGIKCFHLVILLLGSYIVIQCHTTKGNKSCKIAAIQQGIMDTLPASVELITKGHVLLINTTIDFKDTIHLNSDTPQHWVPSNTYNLIDANGKCTGDTVEIISGSIVNIYLR